MTAKNLKPVGIFCFIVCAICTFVAFERYTTNASNVGAVNEMQKKITQLTPFDEDSIVGNIEISPGVPIITKYALFFALISGVGGWYLVRTSQPKKP